MPDGSLVKIPYLEAGKGTPVVYIQAAQHGVELTGVYTINLLASKLAGKNLEGKIFLVPVANPLAVRWRRHFYRMELGEPYSNYHPHQMNRLWPGKEKGNETERLAYALYNKLISSSDYVIDLHCWSMWRCSAALGLAWDRISVEMCRFSLLRFIGLRDKQTFKGRQRGMLHYVATEDGKHSIVIEHSGQRWVFVDEAKRVCEGLLNILRYVGILEGEPRRPPRQFILGKDEHVEILAPDGDWLLVTLRKAGDTVSKGSTIAQLIDLNEWTMEEVLSPIEGIIYEIGATRPHVDTRPSDEVLIISRGERYKIATIYRLR